MMGVRGVGGSSRHVQGGAIESTDLKDIISKTCVFCQELILDILSIFNSLRFVISNDAEINASVPSTNS